MFGDNFWSDVLSTWAKYKKCINVQVTNPFLWYNSHLRIDNHPFFFEKAYRKGLSNVSQLYVDGRLKSSTDIVNEFDLTLMQANGLLSCLKVSNLSEGIDRIDDIINEVKRSKKPSHLYYTTVNQKSSIIENLYKNWSNVYVYAKLCLLH